MWLPYRTSKAYGTRLPLKGTAAIVANIAERLKISFDTGKRHTKGCAKNTFPTLQTLSGLANLVIAKRSLLAKARK